MAKPKVSPQRRTAIESNMEIHPKHVRAIGMISIEMANLELMLGELLASILHIGPSYGRTIYLTPKSTIGRLQILENVLNSSLKPDSNAYKATEKIIGKAREVMGKRNH